jgi:hypothetical protein
MTIVKFINHIYFSYASVDRFLTHNPVNIEAKEDAAYTATMTLSFALSGYIMGILYLICHIFILMLDLKWNRNMLLAIAIISGLILPLCLRTVKNEVYKKYFHEFRNSPHYNHFQWHIISIIFFIIGVSIDLFILIKGV